MSNEPYVAARLGDFDMGGRGDGPANDTFSGNEGVVGSSEYEDVAVESHEMRPRARFGIVVIGGTVPSVGGDGGVIVLAKRSAPTPPAGSVKLR